MPGERTPRPSRQELNRRRRQGGFVGRSHELGQFRDNLARDPGDDAFQYLFHVRGNAGVGKTSLVRQWESVARRLEAVTTYVDDDVHSVLDAMEAISAQLDRQGVPLKTFDKLLATYRQRRHEADAALGHGAPATAAVDGGTGQPAGAQAAPASAPASASSTILAQAGLVGLGMLPGVGAFAGRMDPQKVAQGTDRLRALLNTRLRNHDDVQLVLSPVQVLTPAFLKDLAEAAERRRWLVLFFDVFERTGPVLNDWLSEMLIGEEYGALPVNVVAVLSGQGPLDARCWGDHLDLVTDVPLDVFTEDEARRLLASRGVTDEQVVDLILTLTGRLPVLVDLLAQARPQHADEVGDPSDTAVERFLKWVDDPERHAAALACALPLQLDEDIHRAAVPDATADQYAWLRGLPFVTGQAGRCRYHEYVRTAMLRLQRTQSPDRWREQHTRLADAHGQRRRTVEDALSTDDRDLYWNDADWQTHRRNETYHRLCADPRGALPAALLDLVDACDAGADTLRRWAQIVARAGQDTGATTVADWGRRLEAAADTKGSGLVTALTHLIAAPELEPAGRALGYAVRAREHRFATRYDDALADYTSALTLDPDLARVHFGRGETYRLMGRHEEAVSHFDRAIEHDPDDDMALRFRGYSQYHLNRYAEALADFTRALEIDPQDVWADTQRAMALRSLNRNDQALAELDRILDNEPEHNWILGERAETYRLMERYEEALADFNRALEVDPEYEWALGSRGQLHRQMERYEAALADFDRALEINPDYVWALGQRAETYRLMERYEEALADCSRSLEIKPDYIWALGQRGRVYRSLERYDEALADFDRTLEVDPGYAWCLAQRAETYRLMERYEEALADFDRALEVDPEYAWALVSRGQAYRSLGRYEEALADVTRALEVEPEFIWALGERAEIYGLMGRYEEAVADLSTRIVADLEDDWAIAQRGEMYQSMGRHDEALADFRRSLALDPDEEWCHFHIAMALRHLGRPEEADAWARAFEIGTAATASEDPERSVHALGNLAVMHCAREEWDEAASRMAAFIAARPGAARIRAALSDLAGLPRWLPVDASKLSQIRRRLEEAVTAA
ncbi:tetratricopeptide repeat protein [Streptomyces odontomachi]|uniref:tetratricopeptide repeat protein n=1 Tax=Streptomyces odontomachi TaxID=2944940 RepID=UPI00210DFCFC|nr:tetratricopeptide repeat protein [Streptomyces sp. ODS25]